MKSSDSEPQSSPHVNTIDDADAVIAVTSPDFTLDGMNDEEVVLLIAALGGTDVLCELRSASFGESKVLPESAPFGFLAIGKADSNVIHHSQKSEKWLVYSRYFLVGIVSSAATLLLAMSLFDKPVIIQGPRKGWTPDSIAAVAELPNREDVYNQLSRLLKQLADEQFLEGGDLGEGLANTYTGVLELKNRIDDLSSLSEDDRIWLNESCDRWGALVLDELEQLRNAASNRTLMRTRAMGLIGNIRDELEKQGSV